MERVRLITMLRALLGLSLVTGCAECERTACELLDSAPDATGEGFAGVVASESDVVANGCQECVFAETEASFYPTTAPLDETSARALVLAREGETVILSEKYALEFPSGKYLVCVQSYCANVEVFRAKPTTLNVQLRNGPPSFYGADGENAIVELPRIFVELP